MGAGSIQYVVKKIYKAVRDQIYQSQAGEHRRPDQGKTDQGQIFQCESWDLSQIDPECNHISLLERWLWRLDETYTKSKANGSICITRWISRPTRSTSYLLPSAIKKPRCAF